MHYLFFFSTDEHSERMPSLNLWKIVSPVRAWCSLVLYDVTGREESPGSKGRGCWLTASGGNSKESATENIPPVKALSRALTHGKRPLRVFSLTPAPARAGAARVKWCGKSAPLGW